MTSTPIYKDGEPIHPQLTVTPGNAQIRQTGNEVIGVQKFELTLTNAVMQLGNVSSSYGNIALCTLPDRNFFILGSEAELTIVKGNTTNGIVAATDLDVAIGTAAASNVTLATTMLNILPKNDVDDNLVTVTLANHSLAATPAPAGILDGPTNVLYLNISAGNVAVADTCTVSGTVTVAAIDLGNETS
jgi:hypothetical protein